MFKNSAYEAYNDEKEAGFIITLCKDFDNAIGGGIRIGSITELVGGPGVGKTQICLQLCVNVQIPKNLRGLGGGAIFIDTNRGFSLDRIKEIASATKNHCDRIATEPSEFTLNTILENIYCTFCNNHIELWAAIYGLENRLKKTPKIRLVVIDSFSYLFRANDDQDLNVVQITYEILSKLRQIAEEYKCAIVITNELTTRVTTDGETYIVPSLGESHTHRVNHQIAIGRDDNNQKLFVANIVKCFVKAEGNVPFQITKDGLRPYIKRQREPD